MTTKRQGPKGYGRNPWDLALFLLRVRYLAAAAAAVAGARAEPADSVAGVVVEREKS